VSDNGSGMKDNNSGKEKLGMRLIDIFARQLQGSYQFINEKGLIFKIQFKL
jgi:two-component sensor histidine kinase